MKKIEAVIKPFIQIEAMIFQIETGQPGVVVRQILRGLKFQ